MNYQETKELITSQKAAGTNPMIGFVLKNPEILVPIIKLLWRVIEFALTFFYDKSGRPKKPILVKLGCALGMKFAKELNDICDEATRCADQIKP